MPEVSRLFFNAVRAGLAVKHPYLSHTGRASNAEKQPTGPGPEGCDENGPAARGTYRRIGVCKASSTSSRPPGRYCRVEKQSYSQTPIRQYADPPTRFPRDLQVPAAFLLLKARFFKVEQKLESSQHVIADGAAISQVDQSFPLYSNQFALERD